MSCMSVTSRSTTTPFPPRIGEPTWRSPTSGSDGMRHLRQLARSGLNTVHLLPVNDIATHRGTPIRAAGAGL